MHKKACLLLILIAICSSLVFLNAMQENCIQSMTENADVAIIPAGHTSQTSARTTAIPLITVTEPDNTMTELVCSQPQIPTAALVLEQDTAQELIQLESENLTLLTLAKITQDSLHMLDGFEPEATACTIGMFGTSALATAVWLAKHPLGKAIIHKAHEHSSARETVNIALDVVTRILPPTALVLGSWIGWRKIKNAIADKYAQRYAHEVQKLNQEIATIKQKFTQDLAAYQDAMDKKILALQKKEAQERDALKKETHEKMTQQNREIEQARLNTVQALQAVLGLQDNFNKRAQDLMARLEEKDTQRADALRTEQKMLIDSVATYCHGITEHLESLGAKVQKLNASNQELKEKVALTTPQFKHLFDQLSVIKTGLQSSLLSFGTPLRVQVPTVASQNTSGFFNRMRRRSSLPSPSAYDPSLLATVAESDHEQNQGNSPQ